MGAESTRARKRAPAKTPEGRERQLVAAATDLAEKQILDGTASAQVIMHFLKLGSSRERLEQAKIIRENEVLQAKAEELKSRKDIEKVYAEAIRSMRKYNGQETGDSEDEH